MTVSIGIDWSEQKHDVVFLNAAGAQLASLCIPHRLEGFVQLDRQRAQLGVPVAECVIGIETTYNPIVDVLLDWQYGPIYALPPHQVHANQGRFRQSGARDDPADALLIAEILRTDRGRLHPWRPDSAETAQLRAQVRFLLQWQRHTTRLANQLRAVLLRYYPAALATFPSGLTSQIAPALVLAYPTPQDAQQLSWADFQTFARQHCYPHPARLAACFARLQSPDYPPIPAAVVARYQTQAQELAELLLATTQARLRTQARLLSGYHQHPHYALFASLPGAGEVIGPALLAFFGEDRQRFPDAASVQSLAGTAPVTERSGKHRTVRFRRACDRDWRWVAQEWAQALVTRTQQPLAVAYFQQVLAHGHRPNHAYRCVANRWLAVAWKVWFSGKPYDPAYHLQHRAARLTPR